MTADSFEKTLMIRVRVISATTFSVSVLKSYFAFQHESTEWAKTVISMRNVKPTRLPIVDVAVRDVGNERKKFKLEIGQVKQEITLCTLDMVCKDN